MKISCFLIEPWQEEILRERLKGHELKIFNDALSESNLERAKDSEIIVTRAKFLKLKLNQENLEKFSNLKFIAAMSTGFDHIDLGYCNKKEIIVSNVPVYGENSVAEQTFALILSIIKKIPQSFTAVKNKSLDQNELEGFDLKGKTLGVIGSGKIGLKVIKVAKSFDMKVIAYDVIHNTKACEELGFCYVDLEELLGQSDIITLHAPYNKNTYHLLNKDNLGLLKRGAIIINAARGELINTTDIINCLEDKTIAFVGLDVLEEEGENFQSPFLKKLLEFDNVLITPHNASNTREAKMRMLETTINNILSFIKGSPENIAKEM